VNDRPYSVLLVKVFDDGEVETTNPGGALPCDIAAEALRVAADAVESRDEGDPVLGWVGQPVIEA
jgi:hypothetical protein